MHGHIRERERERERRNTQLCKFKHHNFAMPKHTDVIHDLLDRFIIRPLMNNTSLLVSWTDLHGFNTKLELLFLEVLNPS